MALNSSDRGHFQVLAGYYDRGIPDLVLDDWLGAAGARLGSSAVREYAPHAPLRPPD